MQWVGLTYRINVDLEAIPIIADEINTFTCTSMVVRSRGQPLHLVSKYSPPA